MFKCWVDAFMQDTPFTSFLRLLGVVLLNYTCRVLADVAYVSNRQTIECWTSAAEACNV